MADKNEMISELGDNPFVVTRTFNAPRELVFKALTEADRLAQWWGPKGFKMGNVTLDFRVGGMFHYSMSTTDGFEMWGRFVYREIDAPSRIVFVNSFSDKDGNITRAPFAADWPLEVLNVLTIDEHDGKTTITMKGAPINATETGRTMFMNSFGNMQQGFTGTFDQLDEYLASIK